MRTARRRLTITLTALAVAWAGLTSPSAVAGPGESSFLAKMNAERSGRGLAPVEMYWDLVDDARAHSRRMADENNLYHNPNLAAVTTGWITLGENVGVGPTVDALHAAFMDSAGHRANILGDFNYVGVGVVAEADTKLWVTVVFMRGPEGLNSPPEEPPPPPEPEEAPPPPPETEKASPPAEPPPEPSPPAPEPTPPPPPPPPVPAPTPASADAMPVPAPEPVVRLGLPDLVPFAV